MTERIIAFPYTLPDSRTLLLEFKNEDAGKTAVELLHKQLHLPSEATLSPSMLINAKGLLFFREGAVNSVRDIEVTNNRSNEIERILFRVPEVCLQQMEDASAVDNDRTFDKRGRMKKTGR